MDSWEWNWKTQPRQVMDPEHSWLLLFSELLYLLAVLDFAYKNFSWLKARDVVLINDNGRVPGDVAGNFFLSILVNKTPKPANIDIMAAGHGVFNNGKEGFHGCSYIGFVDSCLVCNLIDYVCFRHGSGVLGLRLGTTKLICSVRIKNNIEKF